MCERMVPIQVLNKKDVKGDGMDDDGDDYTLTPGTEAQYRQIDQEYHKVMQQAPRSELVCIRPTNTNLKQTIIPFIYSKTCVKQPLKKDKTKLLITIGSLMKVGNTFDLH